jgi:hypothetical protein
MTWGSGMTHRALTITCCSLRRGLMQPLLDELLAGVPEESQPGLCLEALFGISHQDGCVIIWADVGRNRSRTN